MQQNGVAVGADEYIMLATLFRRLNSKNIIGQRLCVSLSTVLFICTNAYEQNLCED